MFLVFTDHDTNIEFPCENRNPHDTAATKIGFLMQRQEAMESFAFPDKIKMTKYFIPFIFMTSSFYGKLYIVQLCIVRCCKKPFFSFQYYCLENWIKAQPHYVEAHGPPLSSKVPFVRIDPADWKFTGDNQRVSNSVFKVTWIIYIVRFGCEIYCA